MSKKAKPDHLGMVSISAGWIMEKLIPISIELGEKIREQDTDLPKGPAQVVAVHLMQRALSEFMNHLQDEVGLKYVSEGTEVVADDSDTKH